MGKGAFSGRAEVFSRPWGGFAGGMPGLLPESDNGSEGLIFDI